MASFYQLKEIWTSIIIANKEKIIAKEFESCFGIDQTGPIIARIKKYTLYIPLWRPKKMYKLPERRGGGGGGGNLGNARKKTFFFTWGVP